MHDLNKVMFYKTSFEIRTKNESGDALWELVCILRRWATGKYPNLPATPQFWSKLKRTHRVPCSQDARISFASELCLEEGGVNYWAIAIEEIAEVEGYAPRIWATDVSFSWEASNAGKVSVVLSYGDRPGFLGRCQAQPSHTIPRFIRMIQKSSRIDCTSSGRPVPLGAIELKVGDFKEFWDFVSDEKRDVPIVYVSPRFDGSNNSIFAVEPESIVRSLGPSAFVYFSADEMFCREMRECLPSLAYGCSNGKVRVYASRPNMKGGQDQGRHRFFSADEIEKMGAEEFVAMLRRALAQDVHFYEKMMRPDAVKQKRSRLIFEKSVAEKNFHAAFEIAQDAEAEAESLKDLLEGAFREIEKLESRCEELEEELHLSNAKAETLEYQASCASKQDGDLSGLRKWPLPLIDLITLFQEHNGNKLVFTDRAFRSLNECITDAEVIWNALVDLCEIAYPLYDAESSGDIARQFNSQSIFEFKRGAGSMTRRDSKLIAQYKDTYRGREINVEAHLAKGNKDSDKQSLRLYFGFDETDRKIIVSHIGKHLDNFSTRSRK